MKNYEQEIYALQDSDGNLIGLDNASGGYPWVPSGIVGIYFCDDLKRIAGYPDGRDNKFKVVRVKVIVEEIK